MTLEAGLFLRQLLSNPRDVSAISPSSIWLARAMTEGLGPQSGPVAEFGPGTGRLTTSILARGVAPQDLTLFEMNANFTHHLRQRFPGVHLHLGPAQDAATVLKTSVSTVISGLPLLAMPLALRETIVRAAFAVLAPGGAMVQFTYGQQPPLPAESLERLGLRVSAGVKVWRNLPPARIFRFHRLTA